MDGVPPVPARVRYCGHGPYVGLDRVCEKGRGAIVVGVVVVVAVVVDDKVVCRL